MNEFNGTNIEKMVNLNEKMSLLLKPVNCDITLQNNFDTYLSAYLVEFHDGVRNDQSRTNFQQASWLFFKCHSRQDIAFWIFGWNDKWFESFIPEDEYDFYLAWPANTMAKIMEKWGLDWSRKIQNRNYCQSLSLTIWRFGAWCQSIGRWMERYQVWSAFMQYRQWNQSRVKQ